MNNWHESLTNVVFSLMCSRCLFFLSQGFSVWMMTKMKEQSQRGQRSQGQRRHVHPMLQLLPYQPLVPLLQPSLVSEQTTSVCNRKGGSPPWAQLIEDVFNFFNSSNNFPIWMLSDCVPYIRAFNFIQGFVTVITWFKLECNVCLWQKIVTLTVYEEGHHSSPKVKLIHPNCPLVSGLGYKHSLLHASS